MQSLYGIYLVAADQDVITIYDHEAGNSVKNWVIFIVELDTEFPVAAVLEVRLCGI